MNKQTSNSAIPQLNTYKTIKSDYLNEYLYMNVHNSTIHYSQKKKKSKSGERGMGE